MKIATVTVSGVTAAAKIHSSIPAGIIGAFVELEFPDPYWAGMIKNVQFDCDFPPILGAGNTVEIPAALTAVPNKIVRIGIIGVTGDGKTRITPTLWADLGVVRPSAGYIPESEEGGPEGGTQEPPAVPAETWAQVERMIGNLADLNTQDKSNTVAAINEVLQRAGDNENLGQVVAQLGQTVQTMQDTVGEMQQVDHTTAQTLDKVLRDIEDLKYTPIDITQITDNIVTMELGSVVREVTVRWQLNKAPVSQTLEGEAVDVSERSKTLAGLELRESRSFTLVVTDERDATDSASTAVTFLNGIYYGALAAGAVPDSAAILELTRKLQSGRSVNFTFGPGTGKRPSYACPSRYGTPGFTIGGFEYEWVKLGTIEFTNASGYTESYDVWQHPQDVSDGISITVS